MHANCSNACKSCDMAQRETTQHILFVCPVLETVRYRTFNARSSNGQTSKLRHKGQMGNSSIGFKVPIIGRIKFKCEIICHFW